MRLSIFAKVATLAMALSCVAGGAIGFFVYQTYHHTLVQQEMQDLQYEAQLNGQQLLLLVTELSQDLQLLAHATKHYPPEQLLSIYSLLMHSKPHYTALDYWQLTQPAIQHSHWQYDADNHLLLSHRVLPTPSVHTSTAPQRMATHIVISDLHQQKNLHSDAPMIVINATITSYDAHKKPVARIRLTRNVSPTLAQLQTNNTLPLLLQLVNNHGEIFTALPNPKTPQLSTQQRTQITQFLASPASMRQTHFRYADQAWLLHAQKIYLNTNDKQPIATLLLRIPYAKVATFSVWLAQRSLLIITGILLLALGLSFLLAKRLTQGLARITRTAEDISQGKPNDYLPVARQDEIGTLARTLAKMLGAIEQRNVALQQSNADLSQFAYVASHDLKEPLRKIQTFASLLQKDYTPLLPDAGQEFLTRMVHAVERMRALIDSLLNYAKITNKEPQYQCIDLQVLVNDIMQDLSILSDEQQANITIDTPLMNIEGDALQIRQLLQNLLHNALKFQHQEQHAEVTIRGRLLVGADNPLPQTPSSYQLDIMDNGIGFAPAYAEKIFSMLQRLHPAEAYAGTGIGLAICKRIVERHGGKIYATSVPDAGAVFTVILPVTQPGA